MSRVVWNTDILPVAMVEMVRPNMDNGMAIMQRTLESKADGL